MKPSRRLDFEDVYLYAVTPDFSDAEKILGTADELLKGGVDALQMRSRKLKDRDLFQLGRKLKEQCEKFNALFLVDDRVDIACALDADGVHLGHEDLPISAARALLGHRKIIGASSHSVPQALAAQREGADYVSCGPLWSTPTKPAYEPVGLGLIGLYRAALRIPFIAIGGIDRSNIDSVLQSGAERIAVVRGLFDAGDPAEAARFFKNKISTVQAAEVRQSS